MKNLERKKLSRNKNILLSFYGDDFTGSTDALEFITKAGARTVLFTEMPTAAQLNAFHGLDVFGVAGKTRSLAPTDMEKILLSSFKEMKATGAKHVHYKVCSTFDSSPTIGSIGKAIDCGYEVFDNDIIPVVGGMPSLGRYCLFGNLYARMGIGSNGKIYRLDRHPSMSKHPVTPMSESDLRVHLGKQTKKRIGLVSFVEQERKVKKWLDNINDEEVVLLDAANENDLIKIGEWLSEEQKKAQQLFSVGGSGVEMALGNYWNKQKFLKPVVKWKRPGKVEPLLVISGSCSPVTKSQIDYAIGQGFVEMPLEMEIFNGESGDGFRIGVSLEEVISTLDQNQGVIIHTGKIQEIDQSTSASTLGKALGAIAKQICEKIKLRRVVIAGGDTSSYAARAMEIDAVEMIAPLVSGAPLCRAYSNNRAIDGLEVNFKGGQVGDEKYFEVLMKGKL